MSKKRKEPYVRVEIKNGVTIAIGRIRTFPFSSDSASASVVLISTRSYGCYTSDSLRSVTSLMETSPKASAGQGGVGVVKVKSTA